MAADAMTDTLAVRRHVESNPASPTVMPCGGLAAFDQFEACGLAMTEAIE